MDDLLTLCLSQLQLILFNLHPVDLVCIMIIHWFSWLFYIWDKFQQLSWFSWKFTQKRFVKDQVRHCFEVYVNIYVFFYGAKLGNVSLYNQGIWVYTVKRSHLFVTIVIFNCFLVNAVAELLLTFQYSGDVNNVDIS